jgi:hypothetical protein
MKKHVKKYRKPKYHLMWNSIRTQLQGKSLVIGFCLRNGMKIPGWAHPIPPSGTP